MSTSPFVGEIIGIYRVTGPIDAGAKGSVCLVERTDNLPEKKAIKFIPRSSLADGWQNEITKVMRLTTTNGVVRYISHGDARIQGNDYLWIMWDYIPGRSLKRLIEERRVTVQIINDVTERVLGVLHACSNLQMQHGDLHAGNILVQAPDPLDIEGEIQKIWITDFGQKTASLLASGQQLLDDLVGLNRIINDALRVIDFHTLDSEQKIIFSVLKEQFPKFLLETNSSAGDYVRRPDKLRQTYRQLKSDFHRTRVPLTQNIGDYLAAEVIGERFDEWRRLFVPSFIAADKILDANILVLTGLRGCGKTMVFRRLTALYDHELGIANVPGAGSFYGFYLNARTLAEAFPWLPREQIVQAGPRILHYFNLRWSIEVLEWVRIEIRGRSKNGEIIGLGWLVQFFRKAFGDDVLVTSPFEAAITHLIGFCHEELERSRLHASYEQAIWPLADMGYLDKLAHAVQQNLSFVEKRPFYFFLDDYSTPLVNSTMQEILNGVVFKRSSIVIFKVSTESIESFHPVGLNSKRLEEHDDFQLVDLGTEIILRDNAENEKFLQRILEPRIERHPTLKGHNYTLERLLGNSPYSFNELAEELRKEKPNIRYHGRQIFCSLWSSNVREIISIFARMVDMESKPNLLDDKSPTIIREDTQNKALKEEGGKFLSQLSSATNPVESLGVQGDNDRSYGEHLIEIAKAFQEMARHELRHKRSKNEKNNPPKQARRIEISDVTHDLPVDVASYYSGLIRYGIFIRDARGKSVRGKAVPRLYLRGVLIPYFLLSPNKRDSTTLSWDDFCHLLKAPQQFLREWKKRPQNLPLTTGTQEVLDL